MEVKSVGTNVRMSHPKFGYANTQAVRTNPIFLRLNLMDEFKDAASAVSKKVSLENIIENGFTFIRINSPNYKKAIGYDTNAGKSNFNLFTKEVSAAMLKAEAQ